MRSSPRLRFWYSRSFNLMENTTTLPTDQQIVDCYFALQRSRGFSKACWAYGMLATYGISLDDLSSFTWNLDLSIKIFSQKQKIYPLHPQWIYLFQLKEKQPSNIESCFRCMREKLTEAISTKKTTLNLTDLQFSYRLRKAYYRRQQADRKKKCLSSEALSVH